MWVKENGSNNSTIIQTGKYLVLTNVSASDKGLYVCFAAVTSSQSLEYDDHNDNNSTSLREHKQQIDKDDEVEQNDDENGEDDDDRNEQVLLTSTTTKINHDNDTTFVKPLVENKNMIIHKTTATTTQNASTTSMLPMPNVTRTATTTKTPTLSVSASASASATTATTTTIVIKTFTNANISTLHLTNHTRNPDHNSNNNTNSSSSNSYHSFSNSNSGSNSNSSSDLNFTTFSPITTSTTIDDIEEQEFQAFQKINLTVRTPPGPVTKLYFKASTILGFLIWRFNKTNSGGYPVRSFTAEFRNVSYVSPPFNSSFEHKWSRMDPINIAPNVKQPQQHQQQHQQKKDKQQTVGHPAEMNVFNNQCVLYNIDCSVDSDGSISVVRHYLLQRIWTMKCIYGKIIQISLICSSLFGLSVLLTNFLCICELTEIMYVAVTALAYQSFDLREVLHGLHMVLPMVIILLKMCSLSDKCSKRKFFVYQGFL
ncbi:myosin heavy chain kinase D-like [Lucilia cuprina]|uniref:myosin heavy chain kinase D-like n=1 Tax=Lucilia cuprina TaxID=7375 RepID=UPI001F05487B|nr:myosin heavy chain kinase D-like [Lucilia cuprina]